MVTTGHTAIVTGANHGIGAATAEALARRGCAVLCTFLRVDDPADPGLRRRTGITARGTPRRSSPGYAKAAARRPPWRPTCPTRLRRRCCGADRLGRSLQPVTAQTWTRQFTVDAMARP